MDNYYERFWKKDINKNADDGVTGAPPQWQERDLCRILDCLGDIPLGMTLDAGCGNGYFTKRISELDTVKEVFGIDASETAIQQARKNYPGINFSVSEINSFKFQDGYFDAIFAIEVLEHIVDISAVIKELNRVLKKGGYFIITTTDFNLLKRIIISLFFFDRYFYPTNPHIRFFDKKTLSDILNKSGFSVVRYRWHGSYLGLMPKGQIMVAKKIC
jgi:ubiquinone/menaquinone biosynthesis C-methylase UbiE